MGRAIKIMIDEHQNIKRMLKVARKICQGILDNKVLNAEDFFKLVDYIRNYADKYHHGKEEVILFRAMGEDIGPMATEGPVRGMLIEHDLGRLYMSRLEEALNKYQQGEKDATLDIIANTISYTHLLNQHIQTEDGTLYPFAQKRLGAAALEKVENEVKSFEENPENIKIKLKYKALMEELESKYLQS